MEVTIAKLPEMMMYMKIEDRNWNSGWSSRLKVLKFIYQCKEDIYCSRQLYLVMRANMAAMMKILSITARAMSSLWKVLVKSFLLMIMIVRVFPNIE